MTVVRRLTEGDGLQMVEDTVLQRLTVAVRRDVVAYLADLLDGSRPDRGGGLVAFNPLIDYAAGTVGARIKAIITGIGAGQPWADVEALLANLADQITDAALSPDVRDKLDLITADASVPGSVAALVAAEALARVEALVDEADARGIAISDEAIARSEAIGLEAQARVDALEQEAFDRGVAIDAEADARTLLATQLRGGYTGNSLASVSFGLIYDERQARSTADSSEVSARQALSAKLTGANDPASLTLGTLSSGLLYDEREARATAVSGEASSRVSLATQMRGAYSGTDLASVSSGLIFDERQARSTADSSEVSARQSLSAKLTGATDPTSLTLNTLASGLLFDEREARATAVAAEASSRVVLATQMRGSYTGSDLAGLSAGLLYDERQLRSTADATEVSARQSLSAKLTGANDPASLTLNTLASGLLYDEREARASAVSAEASSRVALSTQMRGAYSGTSLASLSAGLLYDERQARSTADASEVSARQSLSAKLTGASDPTSLTLNTLASGLLYDEREARVSAVAAEASSRVTLATQMRGSYTGSDLASLSTGLLYDERQARSTADATEVSARQLLSAKLTGVNDPASLTLATLSSGLLYDERSARVSSGNAEAGLRVALEVQLRGTYAGTNLESLTSGLIFDERNTRASQVASEASARNTLAVQLRGAYTGTNLSLVSSGLIHDEREARVSAVAAEAYSRSLLAADLGTLSGEVSEEISTRASQVEGVQANYALKVGATRSDGKKVFASIGLNATLPTDGTGGQSEIILTGGALQFVPSDNINADPANVFVVGTVNGVVTLTVPAARIGDLTVGTRTIENNATSKLLASTVTYSSVAAVTVVITPADIPAGASTVPVLVIGSCVTGNATRFFDISLNAADYVAGGNLVQSQPPVGGCWSASLVTNLGVGTHVISCFNHGAAAPAYDAYAIVRTIAVLVSKK